MAGRALCVTLQADAGSTWALIPWIRLDASEPRDCRLSPSPINVFGLAKRALKLQFNILINCGSDLRVPERTMNRESTDLADTRWL